MSRVDQQRTMATLEANREMVRQHIRDSNLDQMSRAMMQAMVDRCWSMDELKALCKSYHLEVFEEEWKMNKADELKLLREQKAALEKKIEKLEHGRWGREPANGSSFKIEKRFSSTGNRYAYIALKADGNWYLTGTGFDASKAYSWEGLKNFAGNYARVWRMTVAEELLD